MTDTTQTRLHKIATFLINNRYGIVALFLVVTIALLISWLLALTMATSLCVKFLRVKQQIEQDAFNGWAYKLYRGLIVGMLRRRFNERQVGHAGTLDPDATGVLVIAVGKATRLLRFIEKTRKEYVGEVVLGTSTSMLDSSGDVTGEFDMSGVTVDDARRVVAEHLMGDIAQIPPMVSAIRVDGRRLHV